jgi:hypothetical protein
MGPTLSKYKEADAAFHAEAMDHILKHYKAKFSNDADHAELKTAILFTDGCGGQFKGKRWLKRIARSCYTYGVVIIHAFHVTAHGKVRMNDVGVVLLCRARVQVSSSFLLTLK